MADLVGDDEGQRFVSGLRRGGRRAQRGSYITRDSSAVLAKSQKYFGRKMRTLRVWSSGKKKAFTNVTKENARRAFSDKGHPFNAILSKEGNATCSITRHVY